MEFDEFGRPLQPEPLSKEILVCVFKTVMFFLVAALSNIVILVLFMTVYSQLPDTTAVSCAAFSVFISLSVFVLFHIGKNILGFKKRSVKDFILSPIIFVAGAVFLLIIHEPLSLMILSMWNFMFLTLYGNVFYGEPYFNVTDNTVPLLIFVWFILCAVIFVAMRSKFWKDAHKKIVKISLISICAAVLIGFNIYTPIYKAIPRMFTEQTYPKVDGATASIPLGEVLARELVGKDFIESKRFVNFNTTHDAYMNLIDGNADIIFAAEPSDAELQAAEARGVILKLTPIGRDAFIFIVNKSNPVDNLSIEQIRDIYSGKITNWKEVGGKDEEIIAYQRTENSGSQTTMEKVVMKGLEMVNPPTERRNDSMGGMMEVVADYENSSRAIGYNIYFYANEMNKKESVKFLSVNGTKCDKSTIKDGTYPFGGNLYAVTREGDVSENTQKMLDWLISEKGQKYIEKGGFVSVK